MDETSVTKLCVTNTMQTHQLLQLQQRHSLMNILTLNAQKIMDISNNDKYIYDSDVLVSDLEIQPPSSIKF